MLTSRWNHLTALGFISLIDPDPAGGGGGDPKPPVPTPPAVPPVVPGEPKSFDQVEVSAIATREHDRGSREGRRTALEEIEAKLGGATLDDVVAAYTALKTTQDAAKSETEKALEAAQKALADAQKDRATAKQEVYEARRTRALTTAGVPTEAHDAITIPGITADSTDEEVTAAVEALKTKIPALFTAAPLPPNSDPTRRPAGAVPPSPTFGAGGKSEFAKRYPDTVAT